MAPDRAPTLADVALASGVHASTVSRVLSRPEVVDPATRARVAAEVARLGYVPNRAARRLAGGRTSAVGLLVPDITNPFFAITVQAAQRRAAEGGALVLLADTARDPATECDAVRSLAAEVDGLVLCSPVAGTAALREAAGGRSLAFVNRRARGVASVVVDQEGVVDLAVGHLRDLGHRRVGVGLGPPGYWSSGRRAAHLGRLGPGIVPLGPTPPTFEGGRALLAPARAAGVTAVAAFNDQAALGLVAEAAAQGVTVPGELSVVGVDGVPTGAMTTPALTTVAVDLEELGRTAVDLLAGGAGPGRRTVAPHVVVRSSTTPPTGARTGAT